MIKDKLWREKPYFNSSKTMSPKKQDDSNFLNSNSELSFRKEMSK